jgi:hypothetical protein
VPVLRRASLEQRREQEKTEALWPSARTSYRREDSYPPVVKLDETRDGEANVRPEILGWIAQPDRERLAADCLAGSLLNPCWILATASWLGGGALGET